MEKIYCKIPPDALFYGLRQPFAKGTVVYCPENNFGVARQDDKLLTVFNDSVTINKKDIPGLKEPFLFGKVQGLDLYFYPYGMTGKFVKKDVTFTSKNGKKAKVSLRVKYNVQIEHPAKVLTINYKFMLNNPNKDGSLTRPEYFVKDIVKYILNEGDSAYTKIDMGASWNMHFVEGEANRRPSEMYDLTLKGRVTLKSMFESFGYKVNECSVEILEFEFLG